MKALSERAKRNNSTDEMKWMWMICRCLAKVRQGQLSKRAEIRISSVGPEVPNRILCLLRAVDGFERSWMVVVLGE